MKIAFIGAQGTGKSTIIDKVMNESSAFKGKSKVQPSIGRTMKSMGLQINEAGNDETQLVALQITDNQFFDKEEKNYFAVFYPRTFIDGLVYSAQLLEEGKIRKSTYEAWYEETKKHMNKYDIIFYIKPEFDLVPDGDRSMNVEFRDKTDNLMRQFIGDFDLNIYNLSGSVEERYAEFGRVVASKLSEMESKNPGFVGL